MVREQLHKLLDDVLDLRAALAGDRVPAEASQHFRAARKEALLGVRVMVDHALAKLANDHAEQTAQPASSAPRSISVEA